MFRLFVLLLLSVLSVSSWAKSPFVVSIHPLYLIAKEITKGVEEPQLLLETQTGHDVSLTPAHRKMIQGASLVIWLGKEHEAPLAKVLKQHQQAISILASGIVQTLPQRNTQGAALTGTIDTHVWLDPNNAVRMGFFIAALRSQQYPEHKAQYWKNAQSFAQQMLQAAQGYAQNKISRPYWSYHDAYQYLERPLNLKFAGAMTDDPHIAPTLGQIKYLKTSRPYQNMCLLAEGHANKSQYQKLDPIVFQAVDASMGAQQNFIVAWKLLAQQSYRCVLNARK